MNRQEFEDTARRYREEMFRMYASQSLDPPPKPPVPPPKPPVPPPKPPVPPQKPPVPPQKPPVPPQKPPVLPQPPQPSVLPLPPTVPIAPKPPLAPPPSDQPMQPVIPIMPRSIAENAPEAVQTLAEPQTPLSQPAYTGTIRVHVSTAQGASPVVGATVTVTRTINGDTQLISLQTTDLSGNVQPVTVPAPPPSEDQRRPESYPYDLSVQAEGYYREHSTDVPVFPNITSMQDFNLIPLPAGSEDPLLSGDITYYNGMQQY